jgi:hypothetical protein
MGAALPGPGMGAEMSGGLDDIDLDALTQPAERDPLDILLEVGGMDDPEAYEIDESDFAALEEEWARLMRLKERKDRLEGLAEKAAIDYSLQRDRMRRAMEAQGTRQFASAEGQGAGSLAREYRVKITNPQVFIGWVNERHPELLSVNSQTLGSFVRNEYRNKGVAPDDPAFPPGVQVIEQQILRVRGTRPVQQEQEQQ